MFMLLKLSDFGVSLPGFSSIKYLNPSSGVKNYCRMFCPHKTGFFSLIIVRSQHSLGGFDVCLSGDLEFSPD